ncbi:hypothetical protein E2320_012773, partial [Naja naja]
MAPRCPAGCRLLPLELASAASSCKAGRSSANAANSGGFSAWLLRKT